MPSNSAKKRAKAAAEKAKAAAQSVVEKATAAVDAASEAVTKKTPSKPKPGQPGAFHSKPVRPGVDKFDKKDPRSKSPSPHGSPHPNGSPNKVKSPVTKAVSPSNANQKGDAESIPTFHLQPPATASVSVSASSTVESIDPTGTTAVNINAGDNVEEIEKKIMGEPKGIKPKTPIKENQSSAAGKVLPPKPPAKIKLNDGTLQAVTNFDPEDFDPSTDLPHQFTPKKAAPASAASNGSNASAESANANAEAVTNATAANQPAPTPLLVPIEASDVKSAADTATNAGDASVDIWSKPAPKGFTLAATQAGVLTQMQQSIAAMEAQIKELTDQLTEKNKQLTLKSDELAKKTSEFEQFQTQTQKFATQQLELQKRFEILEAQSKENASLKDTLSKKDVELMTARQNFTRIQPMTKQFHTFLITVFASLPKNDKELRKMVAAQKEAFDKYKADDKKKAEELKAQMAAKQAATSGGAPVGLGAFAAHVNTSNTAAAPATANVTANAAASATAANDAPANAANIAKPATVPTLT